MSGTSAVESVPWNSPIDTGELPKNGASFDSIVVGGGPGGASAAGYLAMGGQRVLLIEKDIWPRDKICGDAVGGKSLSHVQRLGVKEHLEQTPHFRVTGILFSSPKGHEVKLCALRNECGPTFERSRTENTYRRKPSFLISAE